MVSRIENCHLLLFHGPALASRDLCASNRDIKACVSCTVPSPDEEFSRNSQFLSLVARVDHRLGKFPSSSTVGWSALKPQVVEQKKTALFIRCCLRSCLKQMPNTRTLQGPVNQANRGVLVKLCIESEAWRRNKCCKI